MLRYTPPLFGVSQNYVAVLKAHVGSMLLQLTTDSGLLTTNYSSTYYSKSSHPTTATTTSTTPTDLQTGLLIDVLTSYYLLLPLALPPVVLPHYHCSYNDYCLPEVDWEHLKGARLLFPQNP